MNTIKWQSDKDWPKAHAIYIRNGEARLAALCHVQSYTGWTEPGDKPRCKNCLREIKWFIENERLPTDTLRIPA